MSGRRWRSAIKTAAVAESLSSVEPNVVLGGPSNTYAHYVRYNASPRLLRIRRELTGVIKI